MIAAAGQELLDVGAATSVDQTAAGVRGRLKEAGEIAGVVLLGGLDVVPADPLNAIDDRLRRQIDRILHRSGGRGDSDDFIIWNDDIYGDKDGDRLPELPVSRVADGRDAEFLLTQLRCQQVTHGLTTGVRNYDRPFAVPVFEAGRTPGGKMWVSEPTQPIDLQIDALAGSLYFMLHGRDTDSNRYWGEDATGDTVEAVNMSNVPKTLQGAAVFLGCCWGALTALPRASKYQAGDLLQPKSPSDSLALAFLRCGANGVVGCTGTHYSPGVEPFTYFGQPMHVSFWSGMRQGLGPAQALFEAKKTYAMQLPHGQEDPISRGVELKICRQFSCLGLGW